jgi:serine phosphatase RsbU (regulator of sigma subunit)
VLVTGVGPHLRLDEDYLSFLELVAGQVAAVVTDAQAYQAERSRSAERAEAEREVARAAVEVSVTLQRSILGPVELPEGFAVRYEPAASALEVGGDWYDVVELADGVFGVVVGDVVGRGLSAAAVMGQLRSAGRALLLEANGPAQVLCALDRFAELVPGAACSTVFCAVVDRRAGVLRYSSAGHLPAVLGGADGTVGLLDGAQSLPLAVRTGLARPEAEVPLTAGDSLLLYTDGLVERRHEALDEGIARAVAAVVDGRRLSADVLASVLVDQLLDEQEDDVALLVYRHPAGVAEAP